MKIEALNGLKYNSSNYFFGNSHKVRDKVPVENPLKRSGLSKVPVIVLLAMNPATLNSAIPAIPETDNPNQIVMFAQETKSADKVPHLILSDVQDPAKSEYPFGWRIFSLDKIQFTMPAKGNGSDYDLVFTTSLEQPDAVKNVYLVKRGTKGSIRPSEHPPEVDKLIFHNLGDKNENYCSVITNEDLIGPDNIGVGIREMEIMLDDESAQKIIDLLSGDTKWKNKTYISVKEVFDISMQKPKTVIF